MSLSDRQITINNLYTFSTNALQRNLEFNPDILATETSDCCSAPPPLLIPVPRIYRNFLLNLGLLQAIQKL